MTLLAAIALLSFQGQELSPLQVQVQSVLKERTQRNGYEEYVDAAVLSLQPRTRALSSFLREWTPGQKKPTLTVDTPEWITEKTTLLDAYRMTTKEAEPMFRLIQQGNAKSVTYPNQISIATLFPEFTQFRAIAYLYKYAIIVDLADGEAARGQARLIEGLTFARKMQTGPYISILVGLAMEQIILGTVDENPRILTVDFEKQAAQLPDTADAFKSSVDIEIASQRLTWRDYLTDPKNFLEDSKEIEAAQAISRERADVLYDAALVALEGPSRKARARLDQPEAKWLEPLEASASLSSKFDPGLVRAEEVAPILNYLRLLQMFGTLDDKQNEMEERMLRMFARIRVQRRLLIHTATVSRYRWETGELPKTLADVYGGKEPLDPVNGQPYRLTRIGESFRLSLDVKGVGTVGLLGVPRPGGGRGTDQP